MPYVDGGNEELGPPKKEPKKSMEPDEHEKLSGDMRELYDRLLPSQESEDRRAQLVEKLDRLLNEEWPGNDIRVNVFGSSGNLLSSSDSDVDICITTSMKKLESMHSIAVLLNKSMFDQQGNVAKGPRGVSVWLTFAVQMAWKRSSAEPLQKFQSSNVGIRS